MGDIYGKSVYDELVKNSELYKGLLEENRKLREDLKWYKKQFEHSIVENIPIVLLLIAFGFYFYYCYVRGQLM